MKAGIDARGAIWYRGTGIGTYTYQLVYHLKLRPERNNYRLFWPGEEYKDIDITNKDEFIKIESGNEYWEGCFLPRIIQEEGIDLYHVPQNGIGLPKTKKCRQIVTVHDLIPYVYPETVGKGYLKTFLTEMPRVMDQSDGIITVSQWSKRDIEKIFGYPGDKIHVIFEAPEPVYRPMDKSMCRKFLADNYHINEDYILYVGGFSPRKNIKALLAAYTKLQRELTKPVLLVMPGRRQKEQDYLDTLIAAYDLSEKIIFPGFVPVHHLPYFYNAAQIFVYPSYYEGFGLPPLEAMACGTPTLAARASSIPEVLLDGALLFDPYDTIDLAKCVLFLLNNPEDAANLGRRGLIHAGGFSWEKTAAETVKFYQKVLET